jgi:hypothetical protein
MNNSQSRRATLLTTASIVSFSLTLLGGSFAVFAGAVPLKTLNLADRLDLGSMLFAAPLLILVLALVFEATRLALRDQPLPEDRPVQAVRWVGQHGPSGQ